jgi:hypothetical protein
VQEMIYLLALVALVYWVGLFWFRVVMFFWRHWHETRAKVTRLKNAAVAAYRDSDLRDSRIR